MKIIYLWSSDSAVDSDLLVSSDSEAPDCVAGFGENRGLTGQ